MSSIEKTVYLIGSAAGSAAGDSGCSDGPLVLQQSPYLAALSAKGLKLQWQAMLKPTPESSVLETVRHHCHRLGTEVADLVRQQRFFMVLGGDHSCAIGTWSGVHSAIHSEGPLGLIWIDAHMDSHTPETSPSGNVHGMPLACLLGHGNSSLVNMLGDSPKLKPENVCLIGVRSFEAGEAELLQRLNVRVFFMEEVQQRGLAAVFAEALTRVNQETIAYGVTLDIDSIDPEEAPGTGVSEANGLHIQELCQVLRGIRGDKRFLGAEIVEFDPHHDQSHLTEKCVADLIVAMVGQ